MSSDVGMFKSVQPSGIANDSVTRVARIERSSPNNDSGQVSARQAEKNQDPENNEPLQEVVSNLNELVRDLHRELRFSVDDDSGDTVVKVIDRETDEVLRQIPSEEVMTLRKRLEEAAGVIFSDSA